MCCSHPSRSRSSLPVAHHQHLSVTVFLRQTQQCGRDMGAARMTPEGIEAAPAPAVHKLWAGAIKIPLELHLNAADSVVVPGIQGRCDLQQSLGHALTETACQQT